MYLLYFAYIIFLIKILFNIENHLKITNHRLDILITQINILFYRFKT